MTFNDKTYTVSSATTLTITDCPCTLTHSTPTWAAPTTAPVIGWNSTANATAVGKPSTVVGSATTEVEQVTAYTTYCPGPTTLTIGSSTYTVSSATNLVISASTPFAVTETKSAWTSVVTPVGTGSTGGNGNVSASATASQYLGAASANTVAGSGAFLAFIGSFALLF